MITLKITLKKQNKKTKRIGDYYLYFNGDFIKDSYDKKKIFLKFKNNLIGFLDKSKKLLVINREIENGLPLYYTLKSNELLISSHIGFFIKNNFNLKENKSVIAELLNYGYVLPPNTIYEGIFRISLFNKLIIKLDKKITLIEKDSSRFTNEDQDNIALSEFIEDNLRFDKSKKHTLFFSGGLDSSILCKLMIKQKINFNMFSVGFNFNSKDLLEKRYSLSASKELNKETNYVSFDFKKLILLIPEIIFITEEPIGHIQTLLLYSLMKEHRSKIHPLIVNGQGADGIFGTTSQFNFLNSKGKMDLLKIDFLRFDFLKKKYLINPKENKERFLARLKNYQEIDKDFIFDLEGDVDSTLNSWTKCANSNSLSIIYPFFQEKFIQKISKLNWKVRLKENKFFLKDLARKNGISERLITRRKGTWGPISNKWGELLYCILPISYGYFNEKRLYKFVLNKENRYVLWNIINYSIWRKIFIERQTYSKIKNQLKNLM